MISTEANGRGCATRSSPRFASSSRAEQRGENLPRLGAALDDVAPAGTRSQRKNGADGRDRAVHVERARNDVVNGRLARDAKDAIDGGEQLGQRERQRGSRRRRR